LLYESGIRNRTKIYFLNGNYENFLHLWADLMTTGRRNRMRISLEMRAFLKLNRNVCAPIIFFRRRRRRSAAWQSRVKLVGLVLPFLSH